MMPSHAIKCDGRGDKPLRHRWHAERKTAPGTPWEREREREARMELWQCSDMRWYRVPRYFLFARFKSINPSMHKCLWLTVNIQPSQNMQVNSMYVYAPMCKHCPKIQPRFWVPWASFRPRRICMVRSTMRVVMHEVGLGYSWYIF